MNLLIFLITLLKLLGVVLLTLVVIFIILILIILLVPIKYRFNGEKSTRLYANLEITWFLKLVYFRYKISDTCKMSILKIFGKPFYKNRTVFETTNNTTPSQEAPEHDKPLETQPEIEPKKDLTQTLDNKTQSKETKQPQVNQENLKPENETKLSEINKAEEKEIKVDKEIEQEVKEKAEEIEDEIEEEIEEKPVIKKLEELLNYPDRDKIINLTLKLIHNLCKVLKPQKVQANIVVGTDDPALTGFILAWSSILTLYFGNNFKVEGNFDRVALDGKLAIMGKFKIGSILHYLLSYVLKRPIRIIIWRYLKNRRKED